MTRPEAGAMESTRDSVLDVPQKRQKMEHALGLFSTESVLDLEKLIFDGTILPHGASRLLTGPASNSLAHTTGPLSIQNVVDPCHHCFGLFSWRFPATSSRAHSSLSANQLHEGFDLLRNLSAVGA
jgi:hypothetical protein